MMILDLLGVSGATKSAKMKLIWRSIKKSTGTPFVFIVEALQNAREYQEHYQEHLGDYSQFL